MRKKWKCYSNLERIFLRGKARSPKIYVSNHNYIKNSMKINNLTEEK